MSEKQAIEDAMTQFARSRISLNAKVMALELIEESNLWVGVTVGSTGTHRLIARKQANGTWLVSKHIGSLPT